MTQKEWNGDFGPDFELDMARLRPAANGSNTGALMASSAVP
jgi:hypothetical protein